MMRVAIVGGDGRHRSMEWPDDFDVRCYSSDEVARVVNAERAGSLDAIIVMTKWMGHAGWKTLRRLSTPVKPYPYGFGELPDRLDEILDGVPRRPPPKLAIIPIRGEQVRVEGVGTFDLDGNETTTEEATPPPIAEEPPMTAKPHAKPPLASPTPRTKREWTIEEDEALLLALRECGDDANKLVDNFRTVVSGYPRTTRAIEQRLRMLCNHYELPRPDKLLATLLNKGSKDEAAVEAPPAPGPAITTNLHARVLYEVLGVELGVKNKDQAFDAIAALVRP